jgi:hypothetical protein
MPTQTIKAWGVFTEKGRLARLTEGSLCVYDTEEDANFLKLRSETVRPVTLSWEVEKK